MLLRRDEVLNLDEYPFTIPAIRTLDELELHPNVTFLVGENGSGKSTLIEAIAIAAGFNAEGGSVNFHFSTRASESELHRYLRLVRGAARPRDGFFLRAESFFNVSTEIDQLGVTDGYGGVSLHHQSHGEAFLRLVTERFRGHGLYILDEPEAALSPNRQLSLLVAIEHLCGKLGSQFVIATHSPILLAYPRAKIVQLTASGLEEVEYEDTEHYQVTRSFLSNPRTFLEALFRDGDTLDSSAEAQEPEE